MSKLSHYAAMLLLCIIASYNLSAQTQTLRLRPLSSSDDAEQNMNNGSVQLNSSDLELGGYDWGLVYKQIVGIRFPNVTLPQGATVTKAYIQFSVDETSSSGASIQIKAQKGNAATYAATANNISSRSYTNAIATWTAPAWNVLNQRLVSQQTPDLKALITEATQTGFASGNALAFSFSTTTNGYAAAWAFDRNNANNNPELVIEYTTAAPLSILADKTAGTYYSPFSVILSGTAGATIRYTTDGSTPTATTGIVYSAPISVNATTTVKAISVLNGSTSSVLTLNYVIAPLSVTSDKPSGVYSSPFNVALTAPAGATIRYTTDGSTPTATTGTVYSTPIAVSKATTIKAISILNNTTSSVLTLNYTFQNVVNIKTVKYKITTSSDDAEERSSDGAMFLNSSDLELGGNDIGQNFAQVVGLRFANIAIPANAVITKAYIQFSAKETSQTPLANIDIKIQNSTAAPTFATTARNISTRSLIPNNVVNWATQRWALVNDRTALQQTPDIGALVREAITVGGWKSNMALVVTLGSTTAGWANAISFDGGAAGAPELVIEYGEKPIERTLLSNVFINEATGSNTLNRSLDWIEILNNNSSLVSLDSVYLTDDKKEPTKFMFRTGTTLAPKGFAVINANDTLKVSTSTTAAFGISTSGEIVYMYQHFNGELYVLDSLNVGSTVFNTSWGRSPDGSSKVIKFSVPTPGASNNAAKQLVDLTFSHQRGIQASAFSLTITAPQGMTIRYTTNGSTPSATVGTIYSTPIAVNQNMIVKAYAYNASSESKVVTQTYIINSGMTSGSYTQQQLNDALKELPIVALGTSASDAAGTESPCSFEFINKFGENKSTFVDAGFRIFGNTSKGYPKKNYRVYFKSMYGYNKLKHKVYEKSSYENYAPADEFDALDLKSGTDFMPAGSSYWGLGGLMMSDYMAHELLRRMGNKDIHARFVHLFFNGRYYGLYILRERFNENYMKSYYGAEDTDYEVIDGTYESSTWPVGITKQGTGAQWNDAKQLANSNFQELKKKVDMKHYIDMMLEFFFTDMEHEYRAAAHKTYTNSKFVIVHNDTDGFLVPLGEHDAGHNYNNKLDAQSALGAGNIMRLAGIQGGTFNLEYRTMVRDRVQDLYINPNGLITTQGLTKFLNESRSLVNNPIMLETTRWNFSSRSGWSSRIDAIIQKLPTRLTNVINFFRANNWVHTLQAVSFSKPAGALNIGEKIFITNPNANTQVYYTLDGSDVVFDNGISPTAKLYSSATGITLPLGKTKIRARAFTTGNFGMSSEIEYVVTRPLKITAIAYQPNPAAPAAEPKGSDAFEFFNITNTGTTSIDVSNFMVTEAIDTFRFPQGTSIASGETIMMCSDDTKYPVVTLRKFKWAKGKLANEGENISFKDNLGNLINEVKYDTLAPWPYAKGNGSFIRLKSNTLDNSKGGSWEAAPLSTYLNANVANLQNAFRFVATAQLQGDAAQIQWVANTATKVESYSIEKMNEQGEFELKEVIEAHNLGLQSYTYSDRELVDGDNIYRVKMSQENSLPRYTDPIKVEFKSVGNYMIYPNPVSGDVIMIDLKDANLKETQLELYNSLGQLMRKEVAKDALLYSFPMNDLQAGRYMLVIKPKGKKTVAKSIIVSQ